MPILEARGRVLSSAQKALVNVPGYDNSAMDGYAINTAELEAGKTEFLVGQRIAAGSMGAALEVGTVARIFTGAAIPPGADAVVMQENCQVVGDKIQIQKAVVPAQNIRRAGEDVKLGSELLARGHRLTAQDIGLLASIGIAEVEVKNPLKVALLTTGDELVRPGHSLQPGQIFNSNFYSLSALLQGLNMEVIDLGIIKDDLDSTGEALAQAALKADCIISSGGVSVGDEDHVKNAVLNQGTLSLWKLAIKPGKPFAFGEVCGVPFFGLPGNPVSAFVTFTLLVRPTLLRLLGIADCKAKSYLVSSGFSVPETGVRQEYMRVCLEETRAGEQQIVPFASQSSGVLSSLSFADGLAVLPPHTAIDKGECLRFIPFSEIVD